MILSQKTFCVLSIDDIESNSTDLIRELEHLNQPLKFRRVSSLSEFTEQLQNHHWNFVISNYQMRDFTAFNALDLIKKLAPDIPFILSTDSIGEEIVADMMKAGVEDVVLKSRPERMLLVVKRILKEQETRNKEALIHHLATKALAAKEQMLAIVSHDIKNPLSAIQLEAQMLLKAADRSGKSLLAEEVKIQAKRILKTTDRMKILISDLLDKNKCENGLSQIKKANTHISKLIQDVLDSLRPLIQEKEILTKISLPPDLIGAVDRNKMFQVFSNLIMNAIKYTPAQGSIHVTAEENEHEIIFSLEDSGPGLRDAELKKVFEKYWTGNDVEGSGTGLGLFICKSIVEAHGGHIFVQNTPGRGACFRFNIPKTLPDFEKLKFSFYDLNKDGRKKICIVDDDEDLREVISWALGKEGYSVHSFHSPREALNSLKSGKLVPELVVVDYHMDEMKGGEFLRLKEGILHAKDCPVIMISASPADVEEQTPANLYQAIITKPIDLEGLVNNVRRFLN